MPRTLRCPSDYLRIDSILINEVLCSLFNYFPTTTFSWADKPQSARFYEFGTGTFNGAERLPDDSGNICERHTRVILENIQYHVRRFHQRFYRRFYQRLPRTFLGSVTNTVRLR